MAAEAVDLAAGRHDPAARRRAQRRGRERGCWVYISAGQLQEAGVPLTEAPPFYRTWPGRGGRVIVNLYKEP